jgi:Uncharacterized protein conserved in bacteria (DUF2334)
MRFAIRDDDTSYFTKPEELDRLWGEFLPHVPISLAVVPVSLEPFHLGDAERFYQGNQEFPLEANPDLVAWLRERLRSNSVAVMCHGYSHEYRRTGPHHLEQEYIWKPYGRLLHETREGKRRLESILGLPITTFVPPGNGISGAGLEAVRSSYSNILTTLPLRRPQDLSADWTHLAAYLRRLYYQVRYGMANPFGEDLGGLRLVPSVSVTEQAHWEEIRDKLLLCHRLKADFVAAVHYWEVDQRLKDIIWRLLDLARSLNFEFTTCPQIFEPQSARSLPLSAQAITPLQGGTNG